MTHLSRLTPAETLAILNGDQTVLSDLLKYTFMDLVLKQVLAMREIERQASIRDPIRIHKYVVAGNKFGNYGCKLHESCFLSIFQANSESSVLFRNLVKIAYQNAKNERYYLTNLISSSNLNELFSVSLLQRIVGKFSYTEKGLGVKREIENELVEVEKSISGLWSTDRGRALQLLNIIGGNVFLFKTLEFSISKQFEKEVFDTMTGRTGVGCGAGCWTGFGDYSNTFDSSCASDIGSGCSGDSGCTGCSGCGGCGGD